MAEGGVSIKWLSCNKRFIYYRGRHAYPRVLKSNPTLRLDVFDRTEGAGGDAEIVGVIQLHQCRVVAIFCVPKPQFS